VARGENDDGIASTPGGAVGSGNENSMNAAASVARPRTRTPIRVEGAAARRAENSMTPPPAWPRPNASSSIRQPRGGRLEEAKNGAIIKAKKAKGEINTRN
jgi:hypothetical protein